MRREQPALGRGQPFAHERAAARRDALDDAFVVEVRGSDRGMDVFHHPYAHAAWRDAAA